VPLQDRQDFQAWLTQRQQRETAIHGEPDDTTSCTRCGLTADHQQIVGCYCIECLALDFGAEQTAQRIAHVWQTIATTLLRCDPEATVRLVHALLDHIEDALDDLRADPVD
jgi:predicted  nucleic acid-binding Zn ribbon protein